MGLVTCHHRTFLFSLEVICSIQDVLWWRLLSLDPLKAQTAMRFLKSIYHLHWERLMYSFQIQRPVYARACLSY